MELNVSVRIVVIAAVLTMLGLGCAMRVTGVVRDEATGNPIGGAVVAANDGRDRFSMTDPSGRYTVKTDWADMTLTANAPGFQPAIVSVPGTDRTPIIDIVLQPNSAPAVRRPLVQAVGPGLGSAATVGDGADDSVAGKLRELQDLYDRGLISDDEYRRTRNRIIGGL
jgi:hypothetical protein